MAYPVFNTGDRTTGGLLRRAGDATGLIGVSDSRTLSAVCIFTPRTEEFENRRMIWPGDGDKVNIFGMWAYICYVNLKDASDNTVIGANIELPEDVRYVMGISVDRDAVDFAGALKWIVNGSVPTISQSGTYVPGSDNILTGEVWNLFNRDVGDSGITADVELLGFTTEYIDFSDPDVWDLLDDAKQVGPAGQGLSPTGTAWPLWIVGDPARATAGTANLGTGGAFTKSGTGFTEVTAATFPPVLDLSADVLTSPPYETGNEIEIEIKPDGYAVSGTTIDMDADAAGAWDTNPVPLPAGLGGAIAKFTPSAAGDPVTITGEHSGSYNDFEPIEIEVTGGGPVGIPFTILQGQTGLLLGIDWSEYEPGVYRVAVYLDGFEDPVTFDVTILADVEVETTLNHATRTVGQYGQVTFTLDQVYGVDVVITPSATGLDVTFDDETVTIPAGQLTASTTFLCNEAGEGTIGGADDQGMTGPNSVPLEITEPVVISLDALTLSANSVAENQPVGTVIAAINGTTPGSAVAASGNGNVEAHEQSTDVWVLRTTAILDHETTPSLTGISLTETLAEATNSPLASGPFTITVTNENENPTSTPIPNQNARVASTFALILGAYFADPDQGDSGTYSISGGSLPPGMSLTNATSMASGAIGGVPTKAGSYSATVRWTDAGALYTEQSVSFTVAVIAGTPAILTGIHANGEKGCVYSMLNLDGVYQADSTATPVSAVDQTVGMVLDRSVNGVNASQTTENRRPLLKQDANGKYWIDWDGVNDALITDSIDYGTPNFSYFLIIEAQKDSPLGVALESTGNSSSIGGSFALFSPGTGTNWQHRSRGSLLPTDVILTRDPAPARDGLIGYGHRNDDISYITDGVVTNSSNADQGTAGNFTTSALYIGGRSANQLFADIAIHTIVVVNREFTAAEKTGLLAFADSVLNPSPPASSGGYNMGLSLSLRLGL